MDLRVLALRRMLEDFGAFDRALWPDRPLRRYQLEAARSVLGLVSAGEGGAAALVFSRQSGKDETLARLFAYLLARYRHLERFVVVGAPTIRPQSVVARRRLVSRLRTPLHRGWRLAEGYRVTLGKAGVSFMSADPEANARSETASLLLVANEAQDIEPGHWDATFAPMAASANAPLVVSGTPWMAGSLLSRERAITRGLGTLYEADWRRVAEELPAYGAYVRAQMAKLGERHPFVRTEYELQEIGSEGGLFPPGRQAQMRGEHERQAAATAGKTYALLVDVAGEDEDQSDEVEARGREKRRDSTALTVVEVDLATVKDAALARPTYRVVDRREWVGRKHTELYATLTDLALSVWRARYLVVDATGIGAGLASFLGARLQRTRCEVHAFVFTQKSKSDLGWAFVGTVESGRYKEYAQDGAVETGRFWAQVEDCQYVVMPGPGKVMRWGVPEALGHDDLLVSAALVGYLDGLEWRAGGYGGRTREDWT